MAGLILSIAPVIVFYIFMQRNILRGIAEGAVKQALFVQKPLFIWHQRPGNH
ncbi:MAG: hypothetical protein J0M33_16425 [Anaerolineae bacterium]|nr:hypothetical protein [Anaerolineae bacterium]